MKLIKTLAATAVTLTLLSGCGDDTTNNYYPEQPNIETKDVKIGVYNLSFDRNSFTELMAEMAITPKVQQQLVDAYKNKTIDKADETKALRVIQIRNVAAIIQTVRPAALMVAEFNNAGTGEDMQALTHFRVNYLAVAQSPNGIDGGDELKPISFPFVGNYATNTGLTSGYDLDNNGKNTDPGDAWGFGKYHGQYAFALLSQFPIEHDKVRTFQTFKWKDMPTATNVAVNCKAENEAAWCNDEYWYNDEEWANMPMSSKNHVDAPITIPTANGNKTIHLLMSHPTPPVFDKGTEAPYNVAKNAAEIEFWVDYVTGAEQAAYIYDDKGNKGGLATDSSFVVLGDLNADPENGDGDLTSIRALLNHQRVNTHASIGSYAPKSFGAPECLTSNECKESSWNTPYPEMITSTFGLRVDHATPSSDLNITDSGVYWPASFELGRLLVNDPRIIAYKWDGSVDDINSGKGKAVSSDHRLVWLNIEL